MPLGHQYSSLLSASPCSSEDELFSVVEGDDDGGSARSSVSSLSQPARSWRNLAGFWLLGLCNNYAYVIMLSAAHDILGDDFKATELEDGGDRDCNPTSTGAILLADVVPALVAKLVSPTVNVHTHIRVAVTIMFSAVSFLLVGASVSSAMAYTGVVAASLGSGIGEVTFLAYSSHFHSDVVSTWSSGTGFSGVLGSFSYAALINAGLSPRNTLFVMLICPAVMTVTYTALLRHPPSQSPRCCRPAPAAPAAPTGSVSSGRSSAPVVPLSRQEKFLLLRLLPVFMVPLGVIYFAEYFINQGLVELIWFKNIWLSHSDQYRWLQVVYQIGVFFSRSSVNVFHIERIWILTSLQVANAVFFFYEAYYLFLPSYWLVMAVVLWEGVLGGAAYVNTFYSVYHKFPGREREFIMGTVSLADSLGIALAGAISLPVHDALCTLPGPRL